MGCGASVEGDTDSQASLEEWERSQNSRGGRPTSRRTPFARRKSGYSALSEGDSDKEETSNRDDGEITPIRERGPKPAYGKENDLYQGYINHGYKTEKIALVQDMIPYPNPNANSVSNSFDVHSSLDTSDNEELFIDPVFPPAESSLYHSARATGPKDKVTWMRPHELTSTPQLLVNGVSRQDIIQGRLGDCWFLSSCAAVAQRPDLMEQVIPADQPLYGKNYKGLIQFRFWRFGKWVPVHVDDLIPTKKGKIIYSRCYNPEEFWVSLLEKAYAKIHGSYEALAGGQSMDALVDLTSGLAERYELESAPPNLYKFLLQASSSGAFITCSRKGDWKSSAKTDPNGLVNGHAYTISAVATVKLSTGSEASLVRIRNPWGTDTEWNGDWNDSDNSWKQVDRGTKETMGYNRRGDGEFWMSFQDFSREFEGVTICSLNPDLMGFGESEHKDGVHTSSQMRSVNGRWELDKSCGGSRNNLVMFATNPQFLLTVARPAHMRHEPNAEKKCHIVVALMQLRRRCIRHPGRKMLQIGFVVYKTEEPRKQTLQQFIDNEETGNSGPYVNYREVFARFELWPGYYIIVPATFEPNCPGSFMIRVFADTQVALRELQ